MPLNKLAYSMAKRDSALTKRGVAKQYVAAVGQAPRLDARVAELVDAPDLVFQIHPSLGFLMAQFLNK